MNSRVNEGVSALSGTEYGPGLVVCHFSAIYLEEDLGCSLMHYFRHEHAPELNHHFNVSGKLHCIRYPKSLVDFKSIAN
jgi:hypothetical protein